GALLAATRDLAVRTGRILLTRKGVADPDELSASQRRTWRGRAKSATRHEIEAATGWGAGEVTDLVGLASAPAAVSAVVEGSLPRGPAPWRLARRYWRACGGLAHEDGAHIASALFGEDPATVVPERLTPEGGPSPEPWRHREFHKAVDREVTRVQGRDAH